MTKKSKDIIWEDNDNYKVCRFKYLPFLGTGETKKKAFKNLVFQLLSFIKNTQLVYKNKLIFKGYDVFLNTKLLNCRCGAIPNWVFSEIDDYIGYIKCPECGMKTYWNDRAIQPSEEWCGLVESDLKRCNKCNSIPRIKTKRNGYIIYCPECGKKSGSASTLFDTLANRWNKLY